MADRHWRKSTQRLIQAIVHRQIKKKIEEILPVLCYGGSWDISYGTCEQGPS